MMKRKIFQYGLIFVILMGVLFAGLFGYYAVKFNGKKLTPNASEMHIAFSTNDAYADPLSVAMTSLLWNNQDARLHFYVLYETLSSEKKESLSKVVAAFPNVDLTFLPIQIPDEFLKILARNSRISKDTFSRILLPDLLPHLDKILYLDADLVVDGSLLSLYQINIEDVALSGAIDGVEAYFKKHFKSYNLKHHICAGQLLMNLRYMRETQAPKRLYDFLYDNLDNPDIRWADQDAIKIVLQNELIVNDTIWLSDARDLRGFSTVVFHYAGDEKPWKQEHFQGLYWQAYSDMTDYLLTDEKPYLKMVWNYTALRIKQIEFICTTKLKEIFKTYIMDPFVYRILDGLALLVMSK